MANLLHVKNLSQHVYVHKGWLSRQRFAAIDDISFDLNMGESLAIIGESGSGKSSLAKVLAGINKPSSGDIFVNGEALKYGDYTRRCRLIRMIFQDPTSSLNPRSNIGRILSAPLMLNTGLSTEEQQLKVVATLKLVGLLEEHAEFYPNMLSSGQKQRIAVARALILSPKIIVIDESIAALDVSVRAQIINLLIELQQRFAISYVFVSNDLGLVRHFSDKVLVMQQGKAVEFRPTELFFTQPEHELSQRLLNAYQDAFRK
ncbi:ATP-binding cassette domain-containing protein [Agarivorans sp. 1_MG-2023]|uniref:peptide ABC transporter ATP-binding protein n=1 Tax=Agarivorans sp. 1_MG-2023 TaxID=3062634 RepID=UPI0026E18372|nr:ATP-binding cassette domain-containing protein [Agarivorans sp. 1_MG-2023]MDO6764033.1 ATP-binding cassette domain-containing protein [Agarivorans sp. 1_MG-2023]